METEKDQLSEVQGRKERVGGAQGMFRAVELFCMTL